MDQNPLDRFSHVPTPPSDGGNADPSDTNVLAGRAIGNGGFWPNTSASTDPNLRDCDDD